MVYLAHPNPTTGIPHNVERALQAVRKILDQNKNPMAAADVDHKYDDKYSLVEHITNSGIASTLNVLEQLDGFNEEILNQVLEFVNDQKQSLTLRLAVEEYCEFLEETKRVVESPISHQVQICKHNKARVTTSASGWHIMNCWKWNCWHSKSNNSNDSNKKQQLCRSSTVIESSGDGTNGGRTPTATTCTHKTLTEVTEYHWQCGLRHSLVLFAGTDPSLGIVLGTRTGKTHLVTTMKKHPFPSMIRPALDLDLTFLIQHINQESMQASFKIDREQAKTPRRNKQAVEALQFTFNLWSWSRQCLQYFQVTIRQELLGGKPYTQAEWLQNINCQDVFVPIAPLFMEPTDEQAGTNEDQIEHHGLVSLPSPPAGPLISLKDTTLFLEEQSRSLTDALMSLMGNFPTPTDGGQLVSRYEAKLVLLWLHLQDIAVQWNRGISYVEQMLYNQLVTAVGKQVSAKDFKEFLRFHNSQLMGKSYTPKPFCYAIRQPNQYPDGVISITTKGADLIGADNCNQNAHIIETFSHQIPADTLMAPMLIPLNAATSVQFIGPQYLHGWVDTQFESEQPEEHLLCARTRQFSCFLMLIGNLSGPNEFRVSDAILLGNKDEILIPLLTTALPSAKQFRDAIQSLSPEQARFAKSFRAMQLDLSVFGVCVIQVKPQIEALLKLPPNTLTKEVQLTQDLLTLFAQYQIPPPLVSYDGGDAATMTDKVTAVKQHVKRVLDVIESIKDKQLQEETQKATIHKEQSKEEMCNSPVFDHGFQIECVVDGPGFDFSRNVPPNPSDCDRGREAGFDFSRNADMACMAAPPSPRAGMVLRHIQSQHHDDGLNSVEFGNSEGCNALLDQIADIDYQCQLGGTPKIEGWIAPSLDLTTIPKKLDAIFEAFDKDGALHTMTIKAGEVWTRTWQENLLTEMKTSTMTSGEKKTETNKALDLLDALSCSGSLPVASGEMHIVIGVHHSFEQSVMATVIEENVNPIDKVDYTSLLIGSMVHQVDIPTLLANSAEPPNLVLKSHTFPPLMIGTEKDEGSDS